MIFAKKREAELQAHITTLEGAVALLIATHPMKDTLAEEIKKQTRVLSVFRAFNGARSNDAMTSALENSAKTLTDVELRRRCISASEVIFKALCTVLPTIQREELADELDAFSDPEKFGDDSIAELSEFARKAPLSREWPRRDPNALEIEVEKLRLRSDLLQKALLELIRLSPAHKAFPDILRSHVEEVVENCRHEKDFRPEMVNQTEKAIQEELESWLRRMEHDNF